MVTNPSTNNIKSPLLLQNQAQKEFTINEALIRIDALINSSAIAQGTNQPPANPNDGDTYIIGSNPSNEWRDHPSEIGYFNQGWNFIQPNIGVMIWVQNDEKLFLFNSDNEWEELSISGGTSQPGSLNILSDVAINNLNNNDILQCRDDKFINSSELLNISRLTINSTDTNQDNKLSITSPIVLFNAEGNSIQIQLNKPNESGAASFIFQNNWQTIAEFGVIANDNLAFKTYQSSSNQLVESFIIESNTGEVEFKTNIKARDADSGIMTLFTPQYPGDIKISNYRLDQSAGTARDHGRWLFCNGRTINKSTNPEYLNLYNTLKYIREASGSLRYRIDTNRCRIPNIASTNNGSSFIFY